MGKKRIIYRAINGDSIHTGTMNTLSELFQTDVHNVRNCYYANGSYGGYKFEPIGMAENVVLFEAWNSEHTLVGSKEYIAKKIGCKPKTVRNGTLVKGHYIRRKGTTERIIDEQSIFDR